MPRKIDPKRRLRACAGVEIRSGGACTKSFDLVGVISLGVTRKVFSPRALETVMRTLESGNCDSPSTHISSLGVASKRGRRFTSAVMTQF